MNVAASAPRANPERARLTPGLMGLLVLFVFSTAGTIHFQTPMLPEFGREFSAGATEVAWVAALSFGGFLAGNLFLAPLGDSFDKRRLILGKLACLILGVLAMAAAPSLPILSAAAFVTGVSASVSQHVIPLVAELAAPGERGRAVGTVLSGVFLGILLGRLGGGLVASYLGWRWMYVISAAMLIAIAPAIIARVPSMPAKTRLAYGALMRSLVRLIRERADLRRASAIQFLLGICYGGFWTTLAQMLCVIAWPRPSRCRLDRDSGSRGNSRRTARGPLDGSQGCRAGRNRSASSLIIVAFLVFGFASLTIAAVVIGAVLLDCGLRAAMVANQALVTGVDPNARSRSNTVFAVHVWGGNACGAFIASMAWTYWGWLGVCASGVLASVAALIVCLRGRRGARAVKRFPATVQSFEYFVARPRAFSAGYLAALIASFFSAAPSGSMVEPISKLDEVDQHVGDFLLDFLTHFGR